MGRRRSEAALIRAARRGDPGAVDELFRRHWPAAHRAAYLVTGDAAAAEDVAQEAFLKAIAALDRFDRRRPLGPWLHRIAVNRAIDHARSRAQRHETPGAAEPAAAPRGRGHLPRADGRARRRSPPTTARSSSSATCSATPPARSPACSTSRAGTVNSRLRRGLDALERELRRPPRTDADDAGRRRLDASARSRARAARRPRVPGERGAAARARRAVLEAHAARPVGPRHRWRPAIAVAAVLALAVLAGGLSSPGQAVGDWIRDVVERPAPKPERPAPPPLPAAGRLLVGTPARRRPVGGRARARPGRPLPRGDVVAGRPVRRGHDRARAARGHAATARSAGASRRRRRRARPPGRPTASGSPTSPARSCAS